jgi:polysaccharide pyruvyl transferase WcaK-like protein
MPAPALELARRWTGRALRQVLELDPISSIPRRARPLETAPQVGLVGYYGWGNYGDELFLDVFREHFASALRLRTLVDGRSFRSVVRRLDSGLRGSDAVLIGGGDLLVPWERSARYWKPAYLRRPLFVAGVGVPRWRKPVPSVVGRLERFLSHESVRSIGARDPGSAEWITTTLRPSAEVVVSPDLVWSLTLPPATTPPGAPILGVAVRKGSTPDYLHHVRALCHRAVERGYRIRRIVLSRGATKAIDLAAIEGLGFEDTELVASEDLAVVSRALGECSLVASMKFHGVVVATMYGVPAIALGATTKHRNLMAALGRPDLRVPFTDPSLPDVLDGDLTPVDISTRERMRAEAIAYVGDLRQRILDATAA